MEQEDRIDIYTIPPNFAEEGTLLSGRIKTRNAVETGVILLILVPVLLSLNTTVRVKMYIGMIVLVPVMILSVIGVQGESLFAFIGSFFQYIKQRRYLGPPDERYRMEQNRRKRRDQKVRGRKKEGGQHEKRGSLGKQESDEPERCSGYEGKNGQRKPEGMEQGRKEPGGMDSGGKGAGRKAPGGMEQGRKGAGRQEPGRMESGGKGTGRKESSGKEMGGENTGGKEQGKEQFGGEKEAGRAEAAVETGIKAGREGLKERKDKPGRQQGGKGGEKRRKGQNRRGSS